MKLFTVNLVRINFVIPQPWGGASSTEFESLMDRLIPANDGINPVVTVMHAYRLKVVRKPLSWLTKNCFKLYRTIVGWRCQFRQCYFFEALLIFFCASFNRF